MTSSRRLVALSTAAFRVMLAGPVVGGVLLTRSAPDCVLVDVVGIVIATALFF